MNLEQFLTWEIKVNPEIAHIGSILGEKISDDPAALINDLQNIECWNSRCGYLLSEADSFLDRFSLTAMPPKEGRTEKDREVQLESDCAPIRLVRDILERYCEAIKTRISLGQTILSFQKQFNPEFKVK